MWKQIVMTKVNTAELLDVPEKELKDNQVLVRTFVSTVSCGTEKANLTGDLNVSPDSKIPKEAKFPRYTGYSSSGIVESVGKDVKSVKVGDRVVMSWSHHCNYNVLDEKNIVKIEDERVTFEDGAIAHIGTFPMASLRKTKLEIGESMMVMGLGILGLLAVKFSKLAGAVPVIAVDPVKERRELALEYGADYVFDPFEEGYAEKIKEITCGGVNCAIEVTGIGAGLNQTLDCMAKFGRVALLGCTRDKNFTVDYYRKVHAPGITLIGAHTMARPGQESHEGWFTQRDDIKTILNLLKYKRIDLKGMVKETYNPEECTAVYERLATDKNFPTVVQFDWRNVK